MSTSRSRMALAFLLTSAFAVPAIAHAQDQATTITGRVTSTLGEPLDGAQIFIQEMNLGAVTNQAGTYSLTVPADRARGQQVAVRVRRIGHVPETRTVTLTPGRQELDFQLRVDANLLGQVVVTGVTAGTEQAKVPFKVDRVDVANAPVPAINPLTQLQGRVPGANIVSASGRPGAAPAVILRGPTSINGQGDGRSQEPLYIVDGIIINGALPDLNPQDIESVEVVKGAAAASLYGARAGNGVIQITTKSGSSAPDGVRFNLRSEYGTSDIERDFGIARYHSLLMDETGQYFCQNVSGQPTCARSFDYQREVARVNNPAGNFSLTPAGFPVDPTSSVPVARLRNTFQTNRWPGPTYNAVQQVVDPQPFYQNNLDMTGRFNQTNVFASVGQSRQGGAIRFLEGYTRYSGRLNVDQQIGDAWNVSLRSYYGQAVEDGSNQQAGGGGGAFFRITRTPAFVNLLARDTLGRLYVRSNIQSAGQQNENPLHPLQNINREDRTSRFISGITARYAPLDWVDFEGNFSYDGQRVGYDQFWDKGYRTTSAATLNQGQLFKGAIVNESFNTSANMTVRRTFFQDLVTRASVRYLYEQQDFDQRQVTMNQLAVQGVPQLPNANNLVTQFSTNFSVRQIGMFAGVNAEYRDRYIVDALIRQDGSSLFGAAARWATFGRASLAWRVSEEPWWILPQANEFKLRASYGTAGGRPNFTAQYETFTIVGGNPNSVQLGNRNLRPEKIHEMEVGGDFEFFNRVGLSLTYAQSEARDQILPVPVSSSTGFQTQWQNAGTLENRTWEASLNVPILQRRDLSWSTRLIYDRTRTTITHLNVPPFTFGTDLQATGDIFRAVEGERFGTFYGRYFLRSCGDLPAHLQANCGGATTAFQLNDDGYVVWVGEGRSWRDGIRDNLWQTSEVGCLNNGVAQQQCADKHGTEGVTHVSPWGIGVRWGMPIVLRDSVGLARSVPVGNALPDWRLGLSQNFEWRRVTLYGLLEGVFGRDVWNQGKHWSYLENMNRNSDQAGKSIETAKPLGYYWRAGPPDHVGVGGFYDLLQPNNEFVEDASFIKLREATVSYRLGAIGGVGNWQFSVTGRNLFTITNYSGFDPEVGVNTVNAQSGSSAINAIDAFTFPNLRTVTFGVSTSF